MKKLICILTALLILCAAAVPCFAEETADIILTVKAEQEPKENVVVYVYASKDSALYTTEFYLTYASADLEFIENSIRPGDAVDGLNPIVTATEVAEGKLKISYTGTEPLDEAGAICKLEFRAERSTSAPIFIEIEHAETFDGEHIRALTAKGEGTRANVTEQPVQLPYAAIFAAVLLIGIVVVFILIRKKNREK